MKGTYGNMLVPYFIPLAIIKDLGVVSYGGWGGVHFFIIMKSGQVNTKVLVNLMPKRTSSVEHLSHSEFDMTVVEEMHEQ